MVAKPQAMSLEGAREEHTGALSSRQYLFAIQWIAVSGGMTLFNKYVLDKKRGNFPYPMTMTSWHMFLCTVGTRVLLLIKPELFPSLTDNPNGANSRRVEITPEIIAYRLFPIGLFFAMSLVLANTAYIYLSVAFVQMIKASIPVITMCIMFTFKLEEPTNSLIKIICIISSGVMMAAHGERHFNLFGFIVCCCGVCCEASRLTLVNVMLSGKGLKMDPLSSLYYFAPICFGLIAIACYFSEWYRVEAGAFSRLGYFTFFLNGCVAFYLNVATVYLIKNTNALVMCLGGIVKDILLVSLSLIIFDASITGQQVVGYSIALVGLYLYKEFKKNQQAFDNGVVAGMKAACGMAPQQEVVSAVDDDEEDPADPRNHTAVSC